MIISGIFRNNDFEAKKTGIEINVKNVFTALQLSLAKYEQQFTRRSLNCENPSLKISFQSKINKICNAICIVKTSKLQAILNGQEAPQI